MKLHTDIPTHADIDTLMRARERWCVSFYLPTSPESLGEAERIELRNLSREALDRMRALGADKAECTAVEEQIAAIEDDDLFWRYQARTLAIFATETSITTFRLPNRLARHLVVGDRFLVRPLLRAVTFPQTAFVLELSQGSVRLLEILPDQGPEQVEVPNMPKDLESAVSSTGTVADHAAVHRMQGGEGRKVRMRQFARVVYGALRHVLPERGVPLILAATEPLDSIFRSVCRYPDLTPETIPLRPEPGDDLLLKDAREALDRYYADRLRRLRELFDERAAQGRTVVDIADAARLATIGAVDTLFFDMDHTVPGQVDEETGAVTFAESADGPAYGVVDEIVKRVWLTGGRVLALRRPDVPGGGDVAAILRYALV